MFLFPASISPFCCKNTTLLPSRSSISTVMFSIGKHISWFLKVAYYDFKFNPLVIVTHFTGSLWQLIPSKLSHKVGNQCFFFEWTGINEKRQQVLPTADCQTSCQYLHFSVNKISQSNKPFNLNLTFWFFVIAAIEFYTSALVYMI